MSIESTSASTSRRGAVEAGGGTLVSGALLDTGGRVSSVLFGGFFAHETERVSSAVARSVITVRVVPVLFIQFSLLASERRPTENWLGHRNVSVAKKEFAKPQVSALTAARWVDSGSRRR